MSERQITVLGNDRYPEKAGTFDLTVDGLIKALQHMHTQHDGHVPQGIMLLDGQQLIDPRVVRDWAGSIAAIMPSDYLRGQLKEELGMIVEMVGRGESLPLGQ